MMSAIFSSSFTNAQVEDSAQLETVANLFERLLQGEIPEAANPPIPPENLNDCLAELLGRMVLLPVEMYLDRVTPETRERLKKKLFPPHP